MTAGQWRKIETLYLAAIDVSAEERAELLNRATPDVRAEVEAMLAGGRWIKRAQSFRMEKLD